MLIREQMRREEGRCGGLGFRNILQSVQYYRYKIRLVTTDAMQCNALTCVEVLDAIFGQVN